MKKHIFRSALAVCLVMPFLMQTSCSPQKTDLISDFKKINAEVDQNSEAYLRLGESIQTIGHRLTGSVNGQKVEDYAYELLKSYGFEDVEFQEFEMNGWIRESLTLEVSEKSGVSKRQIPAEALAYSPANASLQGDLVDMGNGLEADYLADPNRAKGKIVLASLNVMPGSPEGTKSIHRSSKVALAIQNGATGIILYNSVAGGTLLTGTASIDGSILAIPAVNVGLEDGLALKEQIAKKPSSAKIDMQNQTGKMKARNVIARIKGNQFPDEKVVIGGHLDSWDLSPGAVDNGLGSFSVIDMARTIKNLNLQPARTMEFVLFMGEEQGLLGSRAYVKQAVADGSVSQIRFMMNYDMTNNPNKLTATLDQSTEFLKSMGEKLASVIPGFDTEITPRAGLYSDHQPFMLQGIPVSGAGGGKLAEKAGQCYHADCDVFELVNDQEMRNTVRVGAMLAYGIASVEDIPVARQTDQELHELLLKNNLKSALELSHDWRWD